MVKLGWMAVAAAALCASAAGAEQLSMLDAMGVTSVSIGLVHAPRAQESTEKLIVVRTRRCVLSRAEGEAMMRAITSGKNADDALPGMDSEVRSTIQAPGVPVEYIVRFERRVGPPIVAALPRVQEPIESTRLIRFNGNFLRVEAARLAEVQRFAERPDCRIEVSQAAMR